MKMLLLFYSKTVKKEIQFSQMYPFKIFKCVAKILSTKIVSTPKKGGETLLKEEKESAHYTFVQKSCS